MENGCRIPVWFRSQNYVLETTDAEKSFGPFVHETYS